MLSDIPLDTYKKVAAAFVAQAEAGYPIRLVKLERWPDHTSNGTDTTLVEMRAVGFKDLNGFIVRDDEPLERVVKKFVDRASSPIGYCTPIRLSDAETKG